MDLLQKFLDVEVKDDTRITEADKDFCKAHQAAYDNAKSTLSELKYFWEDMVSNQGNLLSSIEQSPTLYLLNGNELRISSEKINEQIKATHSVFINQIIYHFNKTYRISISTYEVTTALLPKQPEVNRHFDELEKWKAYENEMLELSLHYTDILEQIFIRLDGRNLQEQAMHELLEKCHEAAWNSHHKTPGYVRKKAVIQFSDYACSYTARYSYEAWELTQKMKHILQGIAHYETGSFSLIPATISSIIGSYDLKGDFFEFPTCEKVQSIKLYKNGRVDIRFATEEYAQKFTEKYLGTVY